jgi:hypothetical protein
VNFGYTPFQKVPVLHGLLISLDSRAEHHYIIIDDAAYFARLGLESWGVDISETAVEAAKEVSLHIDSFIQKFRRD